MDSETFESGKDVDFNDSNINGTLYRKDNVSNIDFIRSHDNNIPRQSSTPSVSSSSSASGGKSPGSTLPVPPDGGWGWVVVFASFMINFIADGVSLSFGILFVDYFESTKAKTSWVGSIFLSMPLLAGPVASYLIDRYGCQRMCILGALLSTVSFVVSIFADSLELRFLTFSLAGLALCYVTSIVIVAYYFEKKRSLATGLAACGTGIGTFIFPPFTMYLLEVYDWRGTLLILSGFFLNMMVFGALMRDLQCPGGSSEEEEEVHHSDSCTLEDSERLCSSLVQLPTYLRDNLPVEVLSELSSKEGGYLNSLLEHHPHLLGSLISKEVNESNASSTSVSRDQSRKEKKYKSSDGLIPRQHSFTSKLDAAYLRNIKVQRGSITYRGAMLNIHRYRLRASSCPDIYRNSMVTITEEKVIVGYVRDKPWINSSLLYSGFIAISGVSLMFLPMILNYYVTASLVGVYGFTISANYTLVSVIIVNLISLEDFTGAYGLLLLVQGIAGLIGPPVAGLLFNMTGNNDITFFCTGLCIVVSGIMVIPVAKTFKCGRKTTTVREDPKEPLTSRSNKVRFQEPQEKEVAIHFQAVPEEEGELYEGEGDVYGLRGNGENSVLLLGKNNALYNVD